MRGGNEPEVCPQVHDLPAPEADQQQGCAEAEPLDAGVGALVGVAQLLLARAQVLHLVDDLGQHLLDAPQLGLDGLELLVGLDGGPVLGVGANVDVELNVPEAVAAAAVVQVVLEADVKGGVCVRREDGALLAGNVLGAAVLVADGIFDLGTLEWRGARPRSASTYMHVHNHAVALVAADRRRHHHQRVLGDKVAYASRVAVCGVQVEPERLASRRKQEQAVQALPQCRVQHCEEMGEGGGRWRKRGIETV